MDEYLHEPLNEEITSIAGHYTIDKEERLAFKGREVLYVVGHAIVDSSCCGTTGCRYAMVQGAIIDWHAKTGDRGLPVTMVERISDPAEREAIKKRIEETEVQVQVQFR
ncbi:hypothetical protein ACFL4G_09695 [Thermodesulfobacteriota bacterium]